MGRVRLEALSGIPLLCPCRHKLGCRLNASSGSHLLGTHRKGGMAAGRGRLGIQGITFVFDIKKQDNDRLVSICIWLLVSGLGFDNSTRVPLSDITDRHIFLSIKKTLFLMILDSVHFL